MKKILFFLSVFVFDLGAHDKLPSCEMSALTSFFVKANTMLEHRTFHLLERKYGDLEEKFISTNPEGNQVLERLAVKKQRVMEAAKIRRPFIVCDNPSALENLDLVFLEDDLYRYCRYDPNSQIKVGAQNEQEVLSGYLMNDDLATKDQREACGIKARALLTKQAESLLGTKKPKQLCHKILKLVNQMYEGCGP